MVINCFKNNLDSENPDEIFDGHIYITLFLQKQMKPLQIVVNGLVPRFTINAKMRLTAKSKLIATRQMRELHQCLLPKSE